MKVSGGDALIPWINCHGIGLDLESTLKKCLFYKGTQPNVTKTKKFGMDCLALLVNGITGVDG